MSALPSELDRAEPFVASDGQHVRICGGDPIVDRRQALPDATATADQRHRRRMAILDALGAYGLMIVGAVIGTAAGGFAAVMDWLSMSDGGVETPRPLAPLELLTAIVPVIAGLGAAALVGPSSDLVHFARSAVGVVVGCALWLVLNWWAQPLAPTRSYVAFTDGSVLEGAAAEAFMAVHREASIGSVGIEPQRVQGMGRGGSPSWRPSVVDWARFAVVRIASPAAAIAAAVLIANWTP